MISQYMYDHFFFINQIQNPIIDSILSSTLQTVGAYRMFAAFHMRTTPARLHAVAISASKHAAFTIY